MDIDNDIITTGDYVFLHSRFGGDTRLVQIENALSKVKLDRRRGIVSIGGLIGGVYGSTWYIHDNTLLQCNEEMLNELGGGYGGDDDDTTTTTTTTTTDGDGVGGRNNETLIAATENQKLRQEEINAMKESGATGKEIIDALVKSSKTFDGKTGFSQEKYLNKKRKKYLSVYDVLRPNTRRLVQHYHTTCRSKIIGLRDDALGYMLSQANVRAGSRLILVDDTAGLLTGAVLARTGGIGAVVNMHWSKDPSAPIINYFNHSEKTLLGLYQVQAQSGICGADDILKKDHNAEMKENSMISEDATANVTTDASISSSSTTKQGKQRIETPEQLAIRKEKRVAKLARIEAGLAMVRASSPIDRAPGAGFDGLLIASKYHAGPLLAELLPRLEGSRPFAVYCSTREIAVSCFNLVRSSQLAVNVTMTQLWCRTFQVLPRRTHPIMAQSEVGGFVVCGTSVFCKQPIIQASIKRPAEESIDEENSISGETKRPKRDGDN